MIIIETSIAPWWSVLEDTIYASTRLDVSGIPTVRSVIKAILHQLLFLFISDPFDFLVIRSFRIATSETSSRVSGIRKGQARDAEIEEAIVGSVSVIFQ